MRQIKEVLRLSWGLQIGERQVARVCQISHTTVSKYLDRAKRAGLSWPLGDEITDDSLEQLLFPANDLSVMQRTLPDWALVRKELMTHKHLTVFQVWEEYRASHPQGYQYSQFGVYYRQWCQRLDLSMRQVHRAGEKVFTDFAGHTVPIVHPVTGEVEFEAHIFVGVLGASNYSYAESLRSQSLPHYLQAHVNMFEYFGGVPELEIIDNLKSGVSKVCRYDPQINPSFHDLSMHYGLGILTARPYKPKDKAKVEKGVQVVERWILAALRHRRFTSLTELNMAIRALLIKLNERPFRKMEGSRKSWFERIDKPALRPLPELPYEFAQWNKCRVNIDYHIELDRHYYSVPCTLVRQEVDVRYTAKTVEIFHRHKRIYTHVRSYEPYQTTTEPSHMPKSHQEYGEWTPDRILSWASTIGPRATEMVQTIMESKSHPALGFRASMGLIRLAKTFTPQRLESACDRACKIGAKSYKHVQSILEKKLDQTTLPELPIPLVIEHSNIRGAEYYSPN